LAGGAATTPVAVAAAECNKKRVLHTRAGRTEDQDLIRPNDEGDWPGGIVQRFRAFKPLVDALIEG